MFRSAREYNYASLCIYFKILHITLHISINNLILKHSDAKIVTKILEAKGIEILIVNNGSLEKNSPFVYTSVFMFEDTILLRCHVSC